MSYNTFSTFETVGIMPEIPGILYGQYERLDEINSRISSRIHSDTALQPNFDPRPISTKYAVMPIVDRRAIPKSPVDNYLEYSTEGVFSTQTTRGPVDGFLRNINIESQLRHQFFALQKEGAGQSVYIPGSESDLYKPCTVAGRQESQPYPDLFLRPQYEGTNTNHLANIGNNIFSNHTRQQLRVVQPTLFPGSQE